MMKPSELMVGDWVVGSSNEPFRIGVIEPDFIYWDEIQPIPLTEEILEKNGFRLVFDGELNKTYFQDIERFHTEIRIDKVGIYQKLYMCDGLGNGVEIVECKNVHQFQHALKLCGISKEIVL